MQGLTPETAIKVPGGKRDSKAVYKHLDNMFGPEYGDYFIISEQVINNKGTDYRACFVENSKGRRTIWFDVTSPGI